MFGSEILEVMIGLVFIYLLCSLVCSAIKEWIARIWDLRANDLEKELIKMLSDNVKKKLYDHPMVQGITRHPKWIERIFNRPGRPSYINAELFSLALTDILMRAGQNPDDNSKGNGADIPIKNVDNGIMKLKTTDSKNDNIANVSALETIIDSVKAEVQSAENSIALFREKIEGWFNTTMEQMSIWYKRKSRIIIFIIAFPLCFALNVDSIMLSKFLYQDETSRLQLVEAAIKKIENDTSESLTKKYNLSPQESTDSNNSNVIKKNEPIKDDNTNLNVNSDENGASTNPAQPIKKQNPIEMAKQLQADLMELGLPIGWNCQKSEKGDIRGFPKGWEWFAKILGLFISSLAISMGATFWFDILKKLIGFRKSVTPQRQEQTETK